VESKSISAIFGAAGDQSSSEILRELRHRHAHQVSHGRSSLEQHLSGTRDILTAWHQPSRVCLAGFLHSGYSTDAFEHRLFDIYDRCPMSRLIGEDAEQMVYLFCSIHRQDLFDALRRTSGEMVEPLHFANRHGGPDLTVTRRDVGDLLVLHIANTAEQCCQSDGVPAPWIAQAAELGQWTKNLADVVPPVFDGCTRIVSRASEDRLLEAYRTALEQVATDPHGARASLSEASAGLPFVAEPFIWLGFLSIAVGDSEAAARFGVQAQALLAEWATPWDKRLTLWDWQTLATILKEASGRPVGGLRETGERARTALSLADNSPERFHGEVCSLFQFGVEKAKEVPLGTRISSRSGVLPSRFEEYVASLQSNQARRLINYYPGLTRKPWYDPEQCPLARDLERAAPEISSELQKLDIRLFHEEAENIHREGGWRVLFLSDRLQRNKEICDLCPVTASVIDEHAAVTSSAGVSYFSCLEPGTRVAPHRGPTNMRLRCHLGIEIPAQCGLKVGGIERIWEEGRCILFDDSFVHEVWNLSEYRRVVLIVDMWHPDLTSDEVNLLKWLSA
jgi:hypothetical protein